MHAHYIASCVASKRSNRRQALPSGMQTSQRKVHLKGFKGDCPPHGEPGQCTIYFLHSLIWFPSCSIKCIPCGAHWHKWIGETEKRHLSSEIRHFYILYQIIISSVSEIAWHYNVNCHPLERIVQLLLPRQLCSFSLFVPINSSMRLHFIRSSPTHQHQASSFLSLLTPAWYCTQHAHAAHNT